MTGKTELSTEDHLKKVQDLLNEYENHLGIKNLLIDQDEVASIIGMKRSYLSKLSKTDCGECAFMLSQYALFLQKELNKETAVLEWVETNLNHVTGKYMGQQGGATLDERRSAVITENSYARDLFKLRNRVRLKTNSLNFLSQKIQYMSNVLLNIQGNRNAAT